MRRKLFVEEVMELVELKTLQNALVGLAGSTGLSTEQRKRLTIAVELVANPSVIFMDEPTSGLDARAAAIVMRTVRNTVDTGRTVVCTIHQPSINIFEAFDELLLVKRGGEVIYAGPLGQFSQELIAYFSQFPGIPPIKAGYNPATWMLEITTPAMESQLDRNFALLYANSELYKVNANTIRELSTPKPGSEDLSFPTQFSQPSAVQFKACLWKQNLTYWRSPYYNAVRFFFTVVVAVLFGSIFWQLGDKRATQQDVFNVMGVLYASVLFLGVNNASSVQPVVSVERSVFYRERAAGMYSPLSYACAQALIEVPYVFAQTIVYGVITYSMIHFEWTAAKFFWYILFMFLTFTYFTMYGMMAVGLTASQQLAAVTSSGFYSLWNLFSGFLIPKAKMPGWWVWYYWICPVAWTLYGLITSQLGDVNTPILAAGFSSQIAVKDFVLGYLGYKYDWLGIVVAVCFVFMGIFWVAFAFAIKFLNFQTR
jgi:energy-coupling factor transporter ATP-binding protein EcfA2/ABC-type multidrug transport system permease subunit